MKCKCRHKKGMELVINIRPGGKNPMRVYWCHNCGSLLIERTSITRWYERDKPILTDEQVKQLTEK